MGVALVRPVRSIAWDLRASWASGRRVSLTIEADERRVEGFVTQVAATAAYARVAGLHVPLDRVLAVHYPSRLGDSQWKPGGAWRGGARRIVPQADELPGVAARLLTDK